jgi:CTP:molybdopterin cytidylyltransferase MocA
LIDHAVDIVEHRLPCAEVKVIDLWLIKQPCSGTMNTAVNTARLQKPAKLIQSGERPGIVQHPVQSLLIHARRLHNASRHFRPAGNDPFVVAHTVEPVIHLIDKISVKP